MNKPKLQAVPTDREAHSDKLRADAKRAKVLARSIYPGTGIMMDSSDIVQPLIELLSIVSEYNDPDERDYLIFAVGEAVYPTTDEGMIAIEAYIKRCASGKGGAC